MVFEKWRKYGNLLLEFLPMEGLHSWAEYNSPNPMTNQYINEATKWLNQWEVKHQWLWDFRHDVLKNALKYSPIGIGVYAWMRNSESIYYKPAWAVDNHWVVLYGYVEGKYWKVFDHYDNVKKKLDWNYPFAFAKTINLRRLNTNPSKEGTELFDRLVNGYIMRTEKGAGAHGEMYFMTEKELVKVTIEISHKPLMGNFHEFLEIEKKFTPVSEKDYQTLVNYLA